MGSSQGKKRKAPKAGWGDWPKACPGDCNEKTRPIHATLEDFPGTKQAVNNLGYCDPCNRKRRGLPPKVYGQTKAADPITAGRRLNELLKWRAGFEADRRWRGVPVEGYYLEGEVPDNPQAEAEQVNSKLPLKCKFGHEYDYLDARGRRRCSTCMKANGSMPGRKKIPEPEPDAPAPHGRCRRNHPMQIGGNGKKYCRTCRNRNKADWRARKAERGEAERRYLKKAS
jgi:hypothetical protein